MGCPAGAAIRGDARGDGSGKKVLRRKAKRARLLRPRNHSSFPRKNGAFRYAFFVNLGSARESLTARESSRGGDVENMSKTCLQKTGFPGALTCGKYAEKIGQKTGGFGQTPDRITGDELAKTGQKLISEKGQGGGKSFQQPRRRPSDSLTEISAKFRRGTDIFRKADVNALHITAANHAADGQPRARSAAKRGGKCTIWAREQSKQAAGICQGNKKRGCA